MSLNGFVNQFFQGTSNKQNACLFEGTSNKQNACLFQGTSIN